MKRYVMLEDKEIIDTSKEAKDHAWGTCHYVTYDNGKELCYTPDGRKYQSLGIIINQSDNLIDLLEVGDIIETKDGLFEYIFYQNRIYYSHPYGMVRQFAILPRSITAIWKRNGDVMRRCEVR